MKDKRSSIHALIASKLNKTFYIVFKYSYNKKKMDEMIESLQQNLHADVKNVFYYQ